MGFPGGSLVKNLPDAAGDAGDMGSIPGLRRSLGGGNGNPLQYPCLENPMGWGSWWATVRGVTKSRTQLGNWAHTHAAAAAVSLQSCPTLCDPIDGSQPGFPSLGFSRQEHWSGLPFPSPMHESEKWKWSHWVVSDSSDPMNCSPPGSSVHGIF